MDAVIQKCEHTKPQRQSRKGRPTRRVEFEVSYRSMNSEEEEIYDKSIRRLIASIVRRRMEE